MGARLIDIWCTLLISYIRFKIIMSNGDIQAAFWLSLSERRGLFDYIFFYMYMSQTHMYIYVHVPVISDLMKTVCAKEIYALINCLTVNQT